jgi:glutamyl-tRNA reductase
MRAISRGDPPEQVLEQLSRGLTNKLLHGPSQFLNRADADTAGHASETIRHIFNLDSPRADDDSQK